MAQADITQAPVPTLAFAESCCFRCYMTPPPPATLKRCSGCKRVKFCTTDCSTQEWKDHKSFCRAFSAIRAREKPSPHLAPLYDDTEEALHARRETQRAQWMLEDDLLGAALGRDPTELEAKLLWREPRCGVCWDREFDEATSAHTKKEWRVCKACKVQAWCCEAHETLGRKTHDAVNVAQGNRSQCQTMTLATEIDEFYLRHTLSAPSSPPALWTPSRLLATPKPLPTSWETYLPSLLPRPTPTNAQVYGVWLEALSPVMTILSDLKERFANVDVAQTLVVHLLGSTAAYEGRSLPLFEELFHQLPALTTLELVLVGPEVPDVLVAETKNGVSQSICGECTGKGRKRTVEWIKGTYAAFLRDRPNKSKPDIVVGFHSGLLNEEESWSETLRELQALKTLKMFTAQTKEEVQDDQSIVGKGTISQNTWYGGWPRIDGWELEGWWRTNNWVIRL